MAKQLRGGPHFSRLVPDSLSERGAYYLAARIREFWLAKGYTIRTVVEPIYGGDRIKATFQIRSNMVNGMPQSGRRA